MKLFIICALVAVTAAVVKPDDLYMNFKFESWRREHNYNFEPFEYVERFSTFKANDAIIAEHNAKDSTYKLGHNEFSHLTGKEWKAMMGFSGVPVAPFRSVNDFADVTAPASVDWSNKGAVTPVKNQGQCGSCWAFSTTGSLEGAYYKKNNKLESFSEQQLVDCDHDGDQGCNGGLMDNAFTFVKQNGGLCRESAYPYVARRETCKTDCTEVDGLTDVSYTDVKVQERALMAAVAQQPVSIAIEADQSGFQLYKSGVFTGECGSSLDHGVLVVGYGRQDDTDYWKVKNSWGASWGVEGYIKLERGKDQEGGQCGILLKASYPTL